MIKMIGLIISGGVGDMIHGFKCAHYIKKKEDVIVVCSCDNLKFRVLKYLFDDNFYLVQIKEEYCQNEAIIRNPLLRAQIKELENITKLYVSWPDLLERSTLSFPYKEYGVSIQELWSTKLLKHKWQPKKRVFIGCCSSTENYDYLNKYELACYLADLLPDYEIFVSLVTKWAGVNLVTDCRFNYLQKNNIRVGKDIDFVESLKVLQESEYAIVADNGISHIAANLGMPRLLLDSRFGYGRNSIPWLSRWKPMGLNDSIPVNTHPEMVARVVATNLKIEQTMLLPRHVILQNPNSDWSRELIFKF